MVGHEVQRIQYFTSGSLRSNVIADHVETKTKLPVTYVRTPHADGTGTTSV